MILLVLIYLMSSLVIVLSHELLHFFMAKKLGYQPRMEPIKFWGAKVVYANRQNHFHNLIIAGIPTLCLVTLGFLIPNTVNFIVCKLLCLINIFNLLPFTADGEIILLSVVMLIKKGKKNK